LVAPVVITVVADWAENLIHWRQLRMFLGSEPLQSAWIQAASIATSTKLAFFWVTTAMVLGLAAWLVVQALSPAK
jgi:hypothetical protein